MRSLGSSIDTLTDPLYGHSTQSGELVIGYVDLLGTLALLSDPVKGRALDGSSHSKIRSSERLPDRRSVYAGRRLEYELEDLGVSVVSLSSFVEAPSPLDKRNRHRFRKCPDCRLSLEPSFNVCPRCTYDLRREAGHGPRCAVASCSKAGRSRRHGAHYCDECGTPLLGGPG